MNRSPLPRSPSSRGEGRKVPGFSPLLGLLILAACQANQGDLEDKHTPENPSPWLQLFNGSDLEGWTPKITHHPLGANHQDTFRVVDGCLRVDYSGYAAFDGQFGHLFYQAPFSSYQLRIEYRFLGEQLKGGPGWALRNSGVMLHCQAPESMGLDQDFPVSIEVQMLGGNGLDPRPNANLCTPGTHVVMGDALVTRHCTDSSSRTYHGEQWVTLEVEVRDGRLIQHILDGKVVLEYSDPQMDPSSPDVQRLVAKDADMGLTSGYIALQSESHPLEFRKVELRPLE